jgi:hypothetical protein
MPLLWEQYVWYTGTKCQGGALCGITGSTPAAREAGTIASRFLVGLHEGMSTLEPR